MPSVGHVYFPFDSNEFSVELYESGNAPDYTTIYNIGVKAGRGQSESYSLKNCPKYDPDNEIEITGNIGSDMMKYNYIGIDYGITGDGKKWYFVTGKTILNYPTVINGDHQAFTVLYQLSLDYWETYKDKIGSPMILLEQVTTSDPGGWDDVSALEQNIVPFSGTNRITTPTAYDGWKTIVGWQSKKPSEQDNFIIDGMRTTLQFNDTSDMEDYLTGLDELATGSPEETSIWRSYIACNTYVVSEYFSTENGGSSAEETLTLANPPSTQVHNRLNYFPYKRAFVSTVDGQNVEIDSKQFVGNKLPANLVVRVYHSTLPQPTSTLYINYPQINVGDAIVFSAYPTMDFVGKNITPTTRLTDLAINKPILIGYGDHSLIDLRRGE